MSKCHGSADQGVPAPQNGKAEATDSSGLRREEGIGKPGDQILTANRCGGTEARRKGAHHHLGCLFPCGHTRAWCQRLGIISPPSVVTPARGLQSTTQCHAGGNHRGCHTGRCLGSPAGHTGQAMPLMDVAGHPCRICRRPRPARVSRAQAESQMIEAGCRIERRGWRSVSRWTRMASARWCRLAAPHGQRWRLLGGQRQRQRVSVCNAVQRPRADRARRSHSTAGQGVSGSVHLGVRDAHYAV